MTEQVTAEYLSMLANNLRNTFPELNNQQSEFQQNEVDCGNPECDNKTINCGCPGPNFCNRCTSAGFILSHDYIMIGNTVPETMPGPCTFKTNKIHNITYLNQYWYYCEDCYPVTTPNPISVKGLCICCADECNMKGHRIHLQFGPFFCDKQDYI